MAFSGNEGSKGGAIALLQESSLYFSGGNASLLFINNHANIVGGAIYVDNRYEQFLYERESEPHVLFLRTCTRQVTVNLGFLVEIPVPGKSQAVQALEPTL